jgi:Zyg-11 protein homolog
MLNLINDRLNRKVFDDVMEVAWSTMWNVTDETAINCERFLDGKGMEYFLGCLKVRIQIFKITNQVSNFCCEIF